MFLSLKKTINFNNSNNNRMNVNYRKDELNFTQFSDKLIELAGKEIDEFFSLKS